MSENGIGKPVKRREDRRFLTGRGRYTDDLRMENQAYAAFVRSPHAHARVSGIDAAAALEQEGVIRVLTGPELVADGIGNIITGWAITSKDGAPMKVGDWSALATDRVRYVGDAVAVVIAETRQGARNAAELVEVSYEELPAVARGDRALQPGAPQLHDVAPGNLVFDWEIGDAAATDAALAAAATVVELSLENNRLAPNAMEPRSAVAVHDPAEDHYTLYTTSQNPHVARLVLSAFYQVAPEHKLRVVAPDVGGGFGSKIYIYPEEITCLWAAMKTGRSVKWTSERNEAFMTDAHGRDHVTTARMGFDEGGRITGFKVETIANLGAYCSLFATATPTYLYATLLSGQYDIPAIHANVKAAYSNTVPVDAYRGAGRPEATYLVERMMTTAARQMGMEEAELRRRNFIQSFPHQTPVIMCYDAGDFPGNLDKAMAAADVAGFPARRAEAAARGMLRGLGYSCYIEACGIAPSKAVGALGAGVGLWESAEMRVNPVGTIEILTGSHSHGQGHETTFAQIVADRFGVPIESISILHGDTDKVQFGMGTYGSRSGAVGMSAIVRAMDKVEAKVRRIAAHLLDGAPEDIVIEDGQARLPGTNRSLAWHEIGLAAYTAHDLPEGMEPGLKETAFYDPVNFTFPAGTYICEVEVDPQTGVVRIVQFTAADDFGTVINPMIVEGQVHGGVAQGIGQALLEQVVYDEAGQLLTGSYMDYCMPRADDVPFYTITHNATVCPGNPLGMKGCGEAGAIGSPPAVINAVTDAIGTNDLSMPATPMKVWQALAGARAPAAAE
ncbi:xanthine dehydrogenase family protein molybdopterin-binding subunit [Mangrovicoccus algicola]|uniref:Xanthine dehydrogenase family protein molybdopterin-binding subunit n=1 Tax=Mangrovicoccus algicola TaxID=2771008 RepID=A0A8J7CHU3_9RHOB|nr:xanthine dehydrogenase family protein molybdopterin-binding subunit [Mangrovicoccus algicola]MBE3638685.1 xanthine dehydrogenase family protein molybdopterin-binding subunit [Mangrovicoccus algicola]